MRFSKLLYIIYGYQCHIYCVLLKINLKKKKIQNLSRWANQTYIRRSERPTPSSFDLWIIIYNIQPLNIIQPRCGLVQKRFIINKYTNL